MKEIERKLGLVDCENKQLTFDESSSHYKGYADFQPISIEKISSSLNTYYSDNNLRRDKDYDKNSLILSNMVSICHNITENELFGIEIFYISDIHIEHQLQKEIQNILNEPIADREDSIKKVISSKVTELINTISDKSGILLICGDVADDVWLSSLFYYYLNRRWCGITISVLGNHELWDTSYSAPVSDNSTTKKSIESIIEEYRSVIEYGHIRDLYKKYRDDEYSLGSSVLLENEVYVKYKNGISRVLSEEIILNTEESELTAFLFKCSIIVLGGIGYSGLNPKYNCECGIYLNTLTSIEEEKKRTAKFRDLYKKLLKCAADRKVIVLTHTPVSDWLDSECNDNWIYVNGHTHDNKIDIKKNGYAIFSDNQLGYLPQMWRVNSFLIDHLWYDPFENYNDGIYTITSEEYRIFNIGRGINCKGCTYKGTLYMLKRNRIYMFLLQSKKSLCLLSGGARKKMEHNVLYFYNNMIEYCDILNSSITPYYSIMNRISEEVKKIGGIGRMHGCIVDISFFSHIYLNPLDGKITPYWAMDNSHQLVFDTISHLLENKEPHMFVKYMLKDAKNAITLTETTLKSSSDNTSDLVTIPKWAFGSEIYSPSRFMKAVQYVLEKNVIRVWREDVFKSKDSK